MKWMISYFYQIRHFTPNMLPLSTAMYPPKWFIKEGTNKLAGTLGAFVCKYKDNVVRVGSGLSDEDRAYFWNNQDKIIGRYITVKYFETSTDSKTGLESLRFPIYMRVREDI